MSRFELDEASELPAQLPRDADWLVLENSAATSADVQSLADRLRSAPWIGTIRVVQIGWSSQLTDVAIVSAFPGLEAVFVRGARILSLNGIEDFRGELIEVDTDKNKKRKLDALARARAPRLILLYGRPDDLEAIGTCASLRDVTLGKAPRVDFALWANLGLEKLALNTCSLSTFEDSAQVPSLRSLSVIKCRKIERFAGDCSNIRFATIDASKVLDVGTIRALSGLENLTLSFADGVPLSTFLPLKELKTLRLWSKVNVDVRAVKAALPKLEELHCGDLPPPDAAALSVENPGLVVVGDGHQRFRNGRPAPQ